MEGNDDVTRHGDFDPDGLEWVRPPARTEPITVAEPDPTWPAQYEQAAERIRAAMGDAMLDLDHVGSTSVPGLPAKPIIDIDLTVVDVDDEPSYVPLLERAGFSLLFREPAWHGHRLFQGERPVVNLHVWGPGSPEVVRHRLFRDWLRDHPADCARYADAKRAAAAETNAAGDEPMDYNRRKQDVIRDLLDRIFDHHGLR